MSAFGSGLDAGVVGSSPTLGSLHGVCFSLCLGLCLSLCVSHEQIKHLKKKKRGRRGSWGQGQSGEPCGQRCGCACEAPGGHVDREEEVRTVWKISSVQSRASTGAGLVGDWSSGAGSPPSCSLALEKGRSLRWCALVWEVVALLRAARRVAAGQGEL